MTKIGRNLDELNRLGSARVMDDAPLRSGGDACEVDVPGRRPDDDQLLRLSDVTLGSLAAALGQRLAALLRHDEGRRGGDESLDHSDDTHDNAPPRIKDYSFGHRVRSEVYARSTCDASTFMLW